MLILCGLLSHQIVGKVCISYLFLCSIFLLRSISFVTLGLVQKQGKAFSKLFYLQSRSVCVSFIICGDVPSGDSMGD